MIDNSNDTELLILYLDGELAPDEVSRVEKRLEAEISLRETLAFIRATRYSIRTHGIRKQVAAIRSDMLARHRPVRSLRPGKWTLRIAAVFFLVLAAEGLYQYTRLTPAHLYNDNFEPFTISGVRSAADSLSLPAAYARHEPARVVGLFHHLAEPSPEDYFLVASAWLSLHQPDSAINSFLSVLEENATHNTHQYQDDAEYYLAMSYLAAGRPRSAIPLFSKIQSDPGHLYHEKVGPWFIRRLHWLH